MAEEKKNNASPPMGRGPSGPRALSVPAEKAKDSRGTFRRLLGFIRPELGKIILVFVCALIATMFNVLAPQQLGQATTEVFNGFMAQSQGKGYGINFDVLRQILATVLVLYMCYSVFTYLQSIIMAQVTQNVVYRLREQAEDKLNRLPLSYFDSHSKGDTLSRVVNDVDLISSTLQDSMTQAINALITVVGVLVMMVLISPLMTLIALCMLPVIIVITVVIAKRSQKLYLAQQTSLGVLDSHIEETYGGHTEVIAFVHEKQAVDDFERINHEYFGHAWRAQFASGLIRPLSNFVSNSAYVAVCVVGAWQVLTGNINVGDIQAFTQYLRNFTMPITRLAGIVNTIQGTLAGAERVFELMDEPEQDDESEKAVRDERVRGGVQFDDVVFSYVEGTPVIKNFSTTVEPGQTVAIVGPTGAGKSTLVNLLMRFYEVDSGSITLDGTDIREYSREDLRKHFGMVLQDTWLFNGTIAENIAYGVDSASDEDIKRVAKAAHADQFIEALPNGYDTVVNEEASNISAGQRQLITIARALLADPEIFILDEATSSIDTRTERFVQKAMGELMKGRTSFVIAHRLSTIREADVILVIRDGDVVEQGTHSELLALNGFYADLHNSQFRDCVDDPEE